MRYSSSFGLVIKNVLKMFILSFIIIYIYSHFCIAGDPYYAAEWSDVIRSCPDFENTHFSCDQLELGSSPSADDDDAGLSLRGKLTFIKDLEDGYSMDLQVYKCTEIGDEPMYSVTSDFCSSLTNSDTPWYPLVATFNSTSCPIPKNDYPLDGLKISIDFAKDVITHEFCGEYKARLAMMNNMDMLSCHMISLAVVEKYDDGE